MKSSGNAGFMRWRRFIVDVLIGSATLAVGLAAIGTTVDILYIVSIAGALVWIGLMLEPNAMAQPAGDTRAGSLRPVAEPKPARPGPQAIGWLDAGIVDATSV
ncbi:MAG TPA: hypothetical protein VG425_01525 [Casimicrobiaceae bacterium]|jgi:hypothetical protein|nr:hypothetical protein [Casimicrobiaceae bacterium]